MKIRDLIEQLQRYDMDGYVCVEANCGSETRAEDITEVLEVAPQNDMKHCAKIIVV